MQRADIFPIHIRFQTLTVLGGRIASDGGACIMSRSLDWFICDSDTSLQNAGDDEAIVEHMGILYVIA